MLIDANSNDLLISHQKHVREIQIWADDAVATRDKWHKRNSYFRKLDSDYLKFLVGPGQRILALGCGFGSKLFSLNPSLGIGVDISPSKIKKAVEQYPNLDFFVGDIEDPALLHTLSKYGTFDVILLSDSLGYISDIHAFLENLKVLCSSSTRLVSVYYAKFWEPLLKLSELLNLRMKTIKTNWLRMSDVENFFDLSGFQTVKKEWRVLLPINFIGLGPLINNWLATLPLIRMLCLRHYLIARLTPLPSSVQHSVTVLIPCRNEKGNIEEAVKRLPKLGSHTEIIFVEGYSSDGTWSELKRVKGLYADLDIKILQQNGIGKGDAVREGFSAASGEILMILDADLTVPPEDLPKFYEQIRSGNGEFINGSRLVYSMEDRAMRLLNYLANLIFAKTFTFILNQPFTDTLCGTKVISRENYLKLLGNRNYFGDFDPFGDFDLIFGATKLNLKIVEVPVRYRRRRYGKTQISRFRHGLLLVQMVIFAYKKLKVV